MSDEQPGTAHLRQSMREASQLVGAELVKFDPERLDQLVDRLAESPVTLTDGERLELRTIVMLMRMQSLQVVGHVQLLALNSENN